MTNCGCRFALLFLTNKIERIPLFDIRQSTFDICHAGVSFSIRLAAFRARGGARVITIGLQLRGIDGITAFEDGAGKMIDSELLDRAGELGRAFFAHVRGK